MRAVPVPGSEHVMLAVLPFQNLSGDPSQDYFSDGLTEEVIAQLGALNPDQLGVIARTTWIAFLLIHFSARMAFAPVTLRVETSFCATIQHRQRKYRVHNTSLTCRIPVTLKEENPQ